MSELYRYLEEIFDTFERVEKIGEVIILGADGGIRRCVLDEKRAYGENNDN